MHYFAYGSNMNHEQMQKSCPGSMFLKPVRLDGYTFVYDGRSTAEMHTEKGAVANIVPDSKKHVWGALYEVSEQDIANLDIVEDIPHAYQKANLVVRDSQGTSYTGVTAYLRPPQEIGQPTADYKATVLRGARDSGLPDDYLARLEAKISSNVVQ